MRLLLRLIPPLVAVFTVIIIPCILIARTQPPPPLIGQLHLADCAAPCWIGIVPGETQAEVVNRYVMETFDSVNSELSSSVPAYEWFTIVPLAHPSPRGEGMPVQFAVNQGTVTEILIPAFFGTSTPDVTMPLLGDMVNLLGAPTCVGLYPNRLSLFYDFEDALLEIGLLSDIKPSWSKPIYFLSLRQNDLPSRVNGCTSGSIFFVAWAGLMDVRHYAKRLT
ncbi:MAG: hypothetical protein K8I30_17760 [Anaerolineae bacterium]|nr:hypothetical protein [Anaerolineae bacterium]